ncbi:alpha/beta hydrolase [Aneurinibacillus sp. REN35]|uniref:alpha/beta hydrolase n=1 Tax=Aneurinibacillus sp. REN35 TaxID=3237286 RepID=UPI0035272BD0
MERVVFTNVRNKMLVGHLYPAESRSIIIMAHGFMSDKISRGRFERLAASFNHAGYAALAFDFSGCGESEDEIITAEKQVDDLRAAMHFVKGRGYERIALYGHSLGSLICLRGYTRDIVTMVLSGALTDAMQYEWDDYFTKEQMYELEKYGLITVHREEGVRRIIRLDQQMLHDFAKIDQASLLQPIACPVLLIHGNHESDAEEKLLLERSSRALMYLPKNSELMVIEGAAHSFIEHMDELEQAACAWYNTHMKK